MKGKSFGIGEQFPMARRSRDAGITHKFYRVFVKPSFILDSDCQHKKGILVDNFDLYTQIYEKFVYKFAISLAKLINFFDYGSIYGYVCCKIVNYRCESKKDAPSHFFPKASYRYLEPVAIFSHRAA